jgi:hypothetical protein
VQLLLYRNGFCSQQWPETEHQSPSSEPQLATGFGSTLAGEVRRGVCLQVIEGEEPRGSPSGSDSSNYLLKYSARNFAENSSLVIFKDKTKSDRLLGQRAIHVRFRTGKPPNIPLMGSLAEIKPHHITAELVDSTTADPMLQQHSLETSSMTAAGTSGISRIRSASEAQENDSIGDSCTYTIRPETWTGNHRKVLERNRFWGPFRIVPSLAQQDLVKRVPLEGLSDLTMQQAPLFFVTREARRAAGGREKKEADSS